jgi:3-deoxy-7-phosphoheptulonate synthase
VESACTDLAAAGLAPHVMVDFSHANSSKQYRKQVDVSIDVAGQIGRGESRIVGAMVESHLNPGRQDLVRGKPLEYGVSITDACLGWDDSVKVLDALAAAVRQRRMPAEEPEE